jgi:hypothetical protein
MLCLNAEECVIVYYRIGGITMESYWVILTTFRRRRASPSGGGKGGEHDKQYARDSGRGPECRSTTTH